GSGIQADEAMRAGDGSDGRASRLRDRAIESAVRAVQGTQHALMARIPRAIPALSPSGGTEQSRQDAQARPPVAEDDLQEQLMRFEGRFSALLTEAFRPLVASDRPETRTQAMADELSYLSSALEIAVGPSPEFDLVDMVTLIALGQEAMPGDWRARAPAE